MEEIYQTYRDMTAENPGEEEKARFAQIEKLEIDFLKKQKNKNLRLKGFLLAALLFSVVVSVVYWKSIETKLRFRNFALEAKRGDTFTFGNYEQDGNLGNGPEDIVWIVLSNKDGVIHAVSKYGLDAVPYHEKKVNITWAECSSRKWLNEEFYEKAFNDREKELIVEKQLKNPDNPFYGTEGGDTTMDKVSYLSGAELDTIYKDPAILTCFPTAYAISQGVFAKPDTGHCDWWTRRPAVNEWTIDVGESSYSPVDSQSIAVRPAIYIQY